MDIQRAALLRLFQNISDLGEELWRVGALDRSIILAVHACELSTGGAVLMNSASIARTVGLPLETARRRANSLADRGVFVREPEGFRMADLEKANSLLDQVVQLIADYSKTNLTHL
jgi:hypothetical protein